MARRRAVTRSHSLTGCAPASGRLTLANIVLMPSPTYRNFHMTPVGKDRFEMLERERDAIGVTAELTGMFAASVGSGLQQLGRTATPTCWSLGPLQLVPSGVYWSATMLAGP